MHRRWLLLPLLSSVVTAFYPYHDGHSGNNDKRFIPLHPFAKVPQDDLVTVDIKKIYHKRENKFQVALSNKPSAENSLAISQDGADYSYFSTMSFGSKGQEMYMLIDTGSANTWVMGSSCTSQSCSVHNTFGPEDSASLSVTTNKWSMTYGTGSVSGVVASDHVKFANFSMDMSFGIANEASDDFNNYPMDGILGLGRATSNELGVPTVMENLKNQGKLAQNILGVHLHRGSDKTKDGELVFGGVNTGKITGQISYTKTSTAAAWEIPVDDAFVDGTACGFTGKSAIVDTGTSYVLMPPADAKKLHSLIRGSVNNGEVYSVPCDSKANVQVSFSGVKYSISPKDYIGGPTTGNSCSSNIIGHQAYGPDEWILGDVFLKNVYSVFDFDQARIGLALLATNTATAASSSASASASSTLRTSATSATAAGSSASPTSSSGAIGNPFDVSSTKKNAAISMGQSYDLMVLVIMFSVIGLNV